MIIKSLEIFEPETYLYNKREDRNNLFVSKYISCFRKGIILGQKPLYYLLKGSYAKSIDKINILTEDERIGYKSILILLNQIKKDTGEFSIYITPHIFTKLVHELRETIKRPDYFKGIMNLFIEPFSYIKEEELKKEEIISFNSFKNMYCGISETAIILLKNKMEGISIIDSSSNKIPELAGDNYLFVDFPTLIQTIKEYERRESFT